MKKFVIETKQNYIEVMKKILSDCDVSGTLYPEVRDYLDGLKNGNKTYNCHVSNNKLFINVKMPYRNSFASTMDLEILVGEDKTRINGSVDSIMTNSNFQKIFSFSILAGSFGLLLMQAVRYTLKEFQFIDWISIVIAVIMFLSALPFAFGNQKKKTQSDFGEPYGVQMEHWISSLFPGEMKITEK